MISFATGNGRLVNMINKSALIKIGLLSLSSLSVIGIAANTLSWFSGRVTIDNTSDANGTIDGRTMGAYFAYGNGIPSTTPGDNNRVYGITKPRHLYNLAWLQYLGYFDSENPESPNYGAQYYFELAADLDMTDWVLPPIGTEDHPFVGNFTGNGHTISNLTVSNNFSEYNTHPTAINQSNFIQPHILGLFGVVGDYNGDYPSYSSSVNEIVDTGIENIKVTTSLHDSLMGLVAGYVDANVENVAVDSGDINVNRLANDVIANATTSYGGFTSNISDHTLVGYTTSETTVKKVTNTLYDLSITVGQEYNGKASGAKAGFGGSIDMNSVFDRLTALKPGTISNNQPYKITHDHFDNGDGTETVETTNATGNGNVQNVYLYHGNTSDYYSGNIVYSTNDTNKHYLLGGTYETNNYYVYYDHIGFRINSGNNSLTVNNIANNAAVANAGVNASIVWNEEAATGANNYKIYTEYNGTRYYLQINNTTALRVVTGVNNGTTFNKTLNDQNAIRYTSGNYYIGYNGGWRMIQLPTAPTVPSVPRPTEAVPDPGELQWEGEVPSETGPAAPVNNVGEITTYANQIYYNNNGTYRFLSANGNTLQTNSTTPYESGWTVTASGNYYKIRHSGGRYLRHRNNTLSLATQTSNTDWERGGNASDGYTFSYDSRYYLRYGNNFTIGNNVSTNLARFGDIAMYDGRYMTQSEAETQREEDLQEYTDAYNQWRDVDYPAWQQARQQYEAAYNAWLPAHNAYVAYVDALDQWDTYDSDLVAYNTALANSYNITEVAITAENPVKGPDYYQDPTKQSTSGMEFTAEDTTYYPINVYTDEEGGYDDEGNFLGRQYEPTLDNTGYFVAGSTNSTWSGNARSIVVSSYSKSSKISGSYSNNKFNDSQILTITDNASGIPTVGALDITDTDKYSKYATSKTSLEEVLNGKSNVGGFHFVSETFGSVSKDLTVMAKNVSINGDKYAEYELPVYSIDFNLKRQGRINFLAGLYNGGNGSGTASADHMNCFFSLYEVYRDGNNAITDIKEIYRIYKKTGQAEYIYSFKDGNGNEVDANNVAFNAAGLEKVFDTTWLGYNNTLYNYAGRVFYFEIPINSGEYCLGNVTHGSDRTDGAYMMYLDIGASASKMNRTSIAEHFLEDLYEFIHPVGVALIPTSTLEDDTFDDSNSFCVIVPATYKGVLSVNRDDSNNVIVARDADYTTVSKPSYISDMIVSVVDPGADPDSTADDTDLIDDYLYVSKTTTETCRVQFYDYSVNNAVLTTTIISDTRVKQGTGAFGNYTRTVTQQNGSADPITLTSSTQMANGDIIIFQYYGGNNEQNGLPYTYAQITNLSTNIFFAGGTTSTTVAGTCENLDTVLLVLYHLYNDSITADMDIVLEMETDDNYQTGTYYKFKDYIIVPVVTGGNVSYVVKSIGGKTIYFIDTTTQLTYPQTVIAQP